MTPLPWPSQADAVRKWRHVASERAATHVRERGQARLLEAGRD